jgi:hypothetical protein
VPASAPGPTRRELQRALRREGTDIVRLDVAEAGGDLVIEARGQDGSAPQILSWRLSPGQSVRELLSRFPIAAVTIVDRDDLPARLVAALDLPGVSLRAIESSSWEAYDRAGPAEPASAALRPPRLTPGSNLLCVLPDGWSDADRSLLDAVLRLLPAEWQVVIPGGDPQMRLGECVFLTGAVPDDELPDWLEAARVRAVLLASSRWGRSDPRARAWPRAGALVAWFDRGAARAIPHLPLACPIPCGEGPAAAADRLLLWLEDGRTSEAQA